MIRYGDTVVVTCDSSWHREEGVVEDIIQSDIGKLYGVQFDTDDEDYWYFFEDEIAVIP